MRSLVVRRVRQRWLNLRNFVGLMERIMSLLKERGADDIPVFLGGIIPDKDIRQLHQMGVTEIYLPDTPIADVVESVRRHILDKERRAGEQAREPAG